MIFRLVELSSRFAVYVDGENGDDQNNGTIDAPVATIDGARKLVQPFLKNMQNHIYVFVKEGRYVLSTDVQWGVEDSGCNGFSVIYTSLGDEEPVISMGKDYSGFQLYDSDKNIYRTFIGVGTNTRQVYINGVRGVRASNGKTNIDYVRNLTANTLTVGSGSSSTTFSRISTDDANSFLYDY